MNVLALIGALLVGLLVTALMVAFIAWAWAKLDQPPVDDWPRGGADRQERFERNMAKRWEEFNR